jgi:hypothetical protein
LKRVIARIEARKPRSVVIDLGRAGSENRAVTDVRLGSPVVTVNNPVVVRAVVRNFGPSRKDGVPVRLVVDGALGEFEVGEWHGVLLGSSVKVKAFLLLSNGG